MVVMVAVESICERRVTDSDTGSNTGSNTGSKTGSNKADGRWCYCCRGQDALPL